MEIYNNLETPAEKEFEQLLKSQFSKNKNITEGKVIEGTVTKTTEKFCFLECGLKSEAVLDINELKTMGMLEKAKEGEKIKVLLERIESRDGEVVVSASKAAKIAGWDKLVSCYEKNEPIIGKISSKCKGGVVVEHIDTGSLLFMPGSQISDKQLKGDISHLMNVPMKLAIIKLDKIRGNACVSRREIISSNRRVDKEKVVRGFKVGDIIKDAVVKGYSSFGCFFDVNNGELDVLVHLQEISYSRISHPDEVFNLGERHDLKVISVDLDKLQVGCSLKQMGPDPFAHISNYELNKPYKVKVVKLMDFGAFCELEPGLSSLLHSSELSYSKKNPSAKKMFKVGDEILCVITEIDREKRRVAISHRLTQENPYDVIEKKYKILDNLNVTVTSKNEYALYCKIDDLDVESFMHCNDLVFDPKKAEQALAKYNIGDKLTVKLLEIQKDNQKIRIGLKQNSIDPFLSFFKNKKEKDIITVKVISSDNSKGLIVQPLKCEMEFLIKKSALALNSSDARPQRWTGGESVDCAISHLSLENRKAELSIKLLESIQNKKALSKYSNILSGKSLPFANLSDKLEKKDKKKKKE